MPADPWIAFDPATDPKRELLWAWVRTESGAGDLGAFDALAERLRPGDPRRAQALAAAERLRREYGLTRAPSPGTPTPAG